MTSEKPSFVFFGSGPVAEESLRLLKENFTIEAIITKPTTETEMRAILPESPLFTVQNKSELDTLIIEQKFYSNLGVLIDFGIIVSNQVIEYFEHGIINSHFSLLPKLRGADPITFAILDGLDKTGVSLMLLVEAMDEGPILTTGELALDGSETTPKLTSNLIKLSNSLLNEAIPSYLAGNVQLQSQNNTQATYTRKFTKSDGIIDWQKPATIIEREVRAFTGWPKSRTQFGELDCVITKVSVIKDSGTAGKLFVKDKQLCVYCGKQSVQIDSLKPAGKKEMGSTSFLAGYASRINL